jgi:hypothetical protein
MKKGRIILLVILVVFGAAALVGVTLFQKQTRDVVNQAPDLQADALTLVAAFDKDSALASRTYLQKIVAVSGTVKSFDSSSVVLGDKDSPSGVVCGLDRRHYQDAANLKLGEIITMQGRCTAYEKGEEMLGVSLGTTVVLSFAGKKN